MLIIKGKNQKSLWLNENYIGHNTLIIDSEGLRFPLVSQNLVYSVDVNEFSIDALKDELTNSDIRIDKVLFYNSVDEETALEFEKEINKEFNIQVAVSIQTDGEIVVEKK